MGENKDRTQLQTSHSVHCDPWINWNNNWFCGDSKSSATQCGFIEEELSAPLRHRRDPAYSVFFVVNTNACIKFKITGKKKPKNQQTKKQHRTWYVLIHNCLNKIILNLFYFYFFLISSMFKHWNTLPRHIQQSPLHRLSKLNCGTSRAIYSSWLFM